MSAATADDARDDSYRDDPAADHYHNAIDSPISFKRRQKPASRYSLFSGAASPALALSIPHEPAGTSLHTPVPADERRDDDGGSSNGDGDSAPWAEGDGEGKRFYDDLTAIDWIFEYTKERLRLRKLDRRLGLAGYFGRLLDPSQIWLVLIGTGVMAGLVAGAIDIVANWLGDLKDGYCSTGFYLSRNFCCWGLKGWPPPPSPAVSRD